MTRGIAAATLLGLDRWEAGRLIWDHPLLWGRPVTPATIDNPIQSLHVIIIRPTGARQIRQGDGGEIPIGA